MNTIKRNIFFHAYRFILLVDPGEIYFLCGLFDAYSDFAVLRTTDRKRAVVELIASPYFINDIKALLASLSQEFPVEIIEEGEFADDKELI